MLSSYCKIVSFPNFNFHRFASVLKYFKNLSPDLKCEKVQQFRGYQSRNLHSVRILRGVRCNSKSYMEQNITHGPSKAVFGPEMTKLLFFHRVEAMKEKPNHVYSEREERGPQDDDLYSFCAA